MNKYIPIFAAALFFVTACTPAGEPIEVQPADVSAATQPPSDEAQDAQEGPADSAQETPMEEASMDFQITSEAFTQEGAIPARYTCDAENISPALAWTGVPEGTQSLALIFDDPDAPGRTWVHWVVFDIPAEISSLAEAVAPDANLEDGSVHGTNDFRTLGYGGPCPPGGTHRYFFKLYALDSMLGLEVGATKEQVLDAMEGHVLDQAELMGTYTR